MVLIVMGTKPLRWNITKRELYLCVGGRGMTFRKFKGTMDYHSYCEWMEYEDHQHDDYNPWDWRWSMRCGICNHRRTLITSEKHFERSIGDPECDKCGYDKHKKKARSPSSTEAKKLIKTVRTIEPDWDAIYEELERRYDDEESSSESETT
jgi:hypothetical protein